MKRASGEPFMLSLSVSERLASTNASRWKPTFRQVPGPLEGQQERQLG
jgi:hypothetical protein